MTQMRREIRINVDYAHLYNSEYEKSSKEESTPKINTKIITTDDYLKRVTSKMQLDNSIIPPNCRYIENVNSGNIVVIEEPPAFRTIKVNMGLRNEITKLEESGKMEEYGYKKSDFIHAVNNFTLAFPYVIFILYVNQYKEVEAGQCFLRVARMSGLSDYLFKIPMLNISLYIILD